MGETNGIDGNLEWLKRETTRQSELLERVQRDMQATMVRVAVMETKLFIWNTVSSIFISGVISLGVAYLGWLLRQRQ